MKTLPEELVDLTERIGRGKAGFGIAPTPGNSKPSLFVGAPKSIGVKGGYIIMIGLDFDQVRELKAQCEAILDEEFHVQ